MAIDVDIGKGHSPASARSVDSRALLVLLGHSVDAGVGRLRVFVSGDRGNVMICRDWRRNEAPGHILCHQKTHSTVQAHDFPCSLRSCVLPPADQVVLLGLIRI